MNSIILWSWTCCVLPHSNIHTDMNRNKHHIAAITPSICFVLQSSVSYPKGFYQWGLRAEWLKLQCAALYSLYNRNPTITFPHLPSWAVKICTSSTQLLSVSLTEWVPFCFDYQWSGEIKWMVGLWWYVLDRLHSVCLLWDGRIPPSRFRTGWRFGQILEKCWLAPAAPG